MQNRTESKLYVGSIKGKIILAFLLGAGAIGLALGTSYLGLNKMLFVIDDIAEPNQKLKTLNGLYRKVTRLEQQQRLEAIENPWKPDKHFLSESNAILSTLDTLVQMTWSDPSQKSRLLEMQQILHKRDSLFILYLKLKSNALRNKKFASQFDTLTRILSRNTIIRDTSVRTTQRKRTTVTYRHDSVPAHTAEPRRSFINRLFSKKKQAVVSAPERKAEVTEEINITVDTVAVAQRNNELKKANQMIQSLEEMEITRRERLAGRELALVRTTNVLFTQMIEILHEVEAEVVASVHKNNEAAIGVFNRSMINIMIILLLFSLTAAALIYFILMDIARSNYYRDQLIEAKEEAEQLGLVKDRFLTNMSHEIRTPLQSIIGYSEQMLSLPAADSTQALTAMHSSSQHLLHIVNEVLDYSRLESGQFKLDNKDFYLLEVVEDVAAAMNIQARQKKLQFILDTDTAENECVSGDPFRLQQILYNLTGNAIKFTHEGTVTLRVQSQRKNNIVHVTFNVTDTGIGILPEEVDRIFSRFEQANATISGEYGGTGLGLSIVKKLVDVQQGKLTVKSTPGKGSDFQVALSYGQGKEDQADVTDRQVQHNSTMHVLVVDDDPLILQLCSIILDKASIRFTRCHEPQQLYGTAIDTSITHILLDIRMANVNGIDLCQYLRKKVDPHVKIIAMSAQIPSDPQSLIAVGFDAILTKPFREQDLYSVLYLHPTTSVQIVSNTDFAALKKLTLNDDELFQSVLAEFITETESDVQQLLTHLNSHSADDVLLTVHKLAGRLGQMGFVEASHHWLQLEKEGQNGMPWSSLHHRTTELIESLQVIVKHSRQHVTAAP